MKPKCLVAHGLALVLCVAAAGTLRGQNESSQETYEGEPVYEVGHGVSAPRAKYHPDPEYDDKDRKKKTNGSVVLSVIVTKDGHTAEIKVLKSLTPGLDKQSIKAVSQWRFSPALKDDEPVAVRIKVETTFSLY